ncbi:MAG: hypothetical protein AB7U29_20365 [Desulfobulbus sp.]|jgi:hypothetical protein
MPLASPLVKTIALVTIENQDKILLVNDRIIGTAEAEDGDEAGAALESVAKNFSDLTGVPTSRHFAEVPTMNDWTFEDVQKTLPQEAVDTQHETFDILVRVDAPRSEDMPDGGDICGMLNALINTGLSDAQDTLDDPDIENEQAQLACAVNIHQPEFV